MARNITPVQIRGTDPDSVEHVTLFVHDDTEYKIPTEIPARLVVDMAEMAESKGELEATMQIMPMLFGREAFNVLIDNATANELRQVTDLLYEVMLGDLTDEEREAVEAEAKRQMGKATGNGSKPRKKPQDRKKASS